MGLLCLPFFAFGFKMMFAFAQICLFCPCQQILLVFFFFCLLIISAFLTLELDSSETECLDGAQILAGYCLLHCANIRPLISTAAAEAPAVCSDPPRLRAEAGGLCRWHQAFSTNPALLLTAQAIKSPGMWKIALTTIPILEAFRTALQRNN